MLFLGPTHGLLLVFQPVIHSYLGGPATLKDRVAVEAKRCRLMDFAAENEGMLGGGVQSGAERV